VVDFVTVSEPKKKRRKKSGPRYLIRRENGDFGPYTVNDVRSAIESREVNLGTEVQEVGGDSWQPAGVFSEFRDYYAYCQKIWAEAELDHSVAVQEKKLRKLGQVKSGAWKLMVLGICVVSALGGWLIYRMMHAEPAGIDSVVSIPEVRALPSVPKIKLSVGPLKKVVAAKVKRVYEAEYHNTGGVRATERASAADIDMDLSDEGTGNSISSGDLVRIKKRNQAAIVRCTGSALKRGSKFKSARITYWVRSARTSDVTVNKPAFTNKFFVACVRRAVNGAKVPPFAGSPRRLIHTVQVSD
jgi:hypothetical protein